MGDVDAPLEGDVTARFATYSTAANLELVMRSFPKTPVLVNTPEEQIRNLARRPSARDAPR